MQLSAPLLKQYLQSRAQPRSGPYSNNKRTYDGLSTRIFIPAMDVLPTGAFDGEETKGLGTVWAQDVLLRLGHEHGGSLNPLSVEAEVVDRFLKSRATKDIKL